MSDAEQEYWQLWREKERLEAENQRLKSLVPLVNEIATGGFEGCGLDGFDIQNMLLKHGVVSEETMTEPCGELCDCASIGCDFPTECYRLVPWFIEAREAMK